jgi:hypothetical protein
MPNSLNNGESNKDSQQTPLAVHFIDLASYYSTPYRALHPLVTHSIIWSEFKGKYDVPIDDIVNRVIQIHLEKSGIFPENWKFDPRRNLFVADALRKLRKAGLSYKSIQLSRGNWSFSAEVSKLTHVDDTPSIKEDISLDYTNKQSEYGKKNSNEWIYLLFHQTDKELATLSGQTVFPCKIGRTSIHPLQRTDVRTYLYSKPIVLEFSVIDAKTTEKIIHELLKEQRINTDNLGSEWFNTNPEQVSRLIQVIDSLKGNSE